MSKKSPQSKGGEIRAENLNDLERSEIASKAAKAKWSLPRAKWGTPDKRLKIGDRELECYVLEDGTRVLSGRGMQEVLGLGQSHGGLLKEFIAHDNIKLFMDNYLAMESETPMRFIRPGRGGVPAVAYEATFLPKLCDIVLEARNKGKLTAKQQEIAAQCEIISRSLAKIGIIALVDEVTGYQDQRDREELQKILDKFVTDEWAKWTKTFPDDYYKELFRLKGAPYPIGPSGKKPGYVGHWTNEIVYSRLAPGIKDELRTKNPRLPSGSRARKHHQYLTRDLGHPVLKEHISNVIFLMRACSNWDDFKLMLDKSAPKYNDTLQLDLED